MKMGAGIGEGEKKIEWHERAAREFGKHHVRWSNSSTSDHPTLPFRAKFFMGAFKGPRVEINEVIASGRHGSALTVVAEIERSGNIKVFQPTKVEQLRTIAAVAQKAYRALRKHAP